jgi:hypothetical protein
MNKPWIAVSARWKARDTRGRNREYVKLLCLCGTEWTARADNLSRMLSRECWHTGRPS